MSVFSEEITLVNPVDVGKAREGIIKESEVRRLTVDALVDTGAWTLVIGEATRKKLGLEIMGPSTSEAADGVVVAGFNTEPVTIYWHDRYTACTAFVLPNETEVLLGALPLEGMDLMVYPKGERLIGVHGDQPMYKVK
jgi:predicted aspartyl protease